MKEKLTPYLRSLAHAASISRQYVIADGMDAQASQYSDPLMEDTHEPVKGLIHKYGNRALIKVSYQCAAHCRFCTRIRQIGNPAGTLTEEDFPKILTYLSTHPEIDEVILSGGDPFYTPKLTLSLLHRLAALSSIKVLRIGTRLPVQSPASFSSPGMQPLLEAISAIGNDKPFYILLHIEHPDELTPQALDVVKSLRTLNITLLSQTVFLRGINDNYDVLFTLFTRLHHIGVIPYYIYHCDAVAGLEHFAGDIAEETEIMTRLRSTLSGIACPTFVLDLPEGYGKLPVPLNFFNEDGTVQRDFGGLTEPILA